MKKLVILLVLLLIPVVFAVSSQAWINQHQLQNIASVGSNLKFEVYDVNNKLVNRDPEVGEKFVLSTDADFVWNKVYVYPDIPLNFINSFDLSVKKVGHSVLVIPGKRRGLFTRGRKAVYATYNTDSGVSDKIDTSLWTPQDYHLLAWTCTTNRNAHWQSNGVWDCSWKVHTFTLKSSATLPVVTTNCGNGKCDSNEDPFNCVLDCPDSIFCGNHRCDPGENLNNCPEDQRACWDFVNAMTHCGNPWTNTNEHCDPYASYNKFLNPWGRISSTSTSYTQTPVTCKTLGFRQGTLNCLSNCLIDASNCNNNVCGDNVCSPGETSTNCASDCLIGPAPSKTVPNCVKPPQPQVNIWKVDKDTVLCAGSYDLPKGVEIDNSVLFDCNNAELTGDLSGGGDLFVYADNVNIKNCNFKDLIVTTGLSVSNTGQLNAGKTSLNTLIENNNFLPKSFIDGSFKNSRIKNNNIVHLSLVNDASNNEIVNNKGVFSIYLSARSSNNKLLNNYVEEVEIFFFSNENELRNNNLKKLTLGWVFPFSGVNKNLINDNNIEQVFLKSFSSENKINNNNLNQVIISSSSRNSITDNSIIGLNNLLSAQYYGLLMLRNSNKNLIEHNLLNGNKLGFTGIKIDGDSNDLNLNNIENNNAGVSLSSASGNNDVVKNNFVDNEFSSPQGTVINHVEDGTTQNYHSRNYYSGFSDDPNQCKDANNDNFCDDSYVISRSWGVLAEDKTPSKVKN